MHVSEMHALVTGLQSFWQFNLIERIVPQLTIEGFEELDWWCRLFCIPINVQKFIKGEFSDPKSNIVSDIIFNTH